jgi:glycine oxidase
MPTRDVVVIGGGVIGCGVARELARQGASVTLLERTAIGAGASSAAAGMLGAQGESDAPGPLVDLAIASRRLFPAFVAALCEETGIDCEYEAAGIIYGVLTDDDEETLRRRASWQQRAGLAVERLSREEALALEPNLTPDIRWAVHFPQDHRVNPRRLADALGAAAARAGAEVVTVRTVVRVTASATRVTGVECDGARYAAASVVNAAGSWAGLIEVPNRTVAPPVFPVRGQMVVLSGPAPGQRHALHSTRGYIVPRRDGSMLVGSTYENVGYDKRVTVRGVAAILEDAVALR